jgi:Fe-S cluster assembly ATPase SufC
MALDSTILEIKDLQVSINENEIFKNLNLKLIGRNSCNNGAQWVRQKYFSKVLAGHPYSISNGDIKTQGFV